jgi:hypothetical protein
MKEALLATGIIVAVLALIISFLVWSDRQATQRERRECQGLYVAVHSARDSLLVVAARPVCARYAVEAPR